MVLNCGGRGIGLVDWSIRLAQAAKGRDPDGSDPVPEDVLSLKRKHPLLRVFFSVSMRNTPDGRRDRTARAPSQVRTPVHTASKTPCRAATPAAAPLATTRQDFGAVLRPRSGIEVLGAVGGRNDPHDLR